MGGLQSAAWPPVLPGVSSQMQPLSSEEVSILRMKEQKPALLLRLTGKPPLPPAFFHSLNALGSAPVCVAGRIRLTILLVSPGQSISRLALSGSLPLNFPTSPCAEVRWVCLPTGPPLFGPAVSIVAVNVENERIAKRCIDFILTPCIKLYSVAEVCCRPGRPGPG